MGPRSVMACGLCLLMAWGAAGVARGADAQASHDAVEALRQYLLTDVARRAPLAAQSFADTPLTRGDADAARRLLWNDHVVQIRQTRAAEVKDRILQDGALRMPFFYRIFGDQPKNGRSLYISMHGGGNASQALNDQQWENHKHLYTLQEGVYLAPRAPTNTWNLWHEAHIDSMFDRLIEDLIVFEDVDPNRIYLMGYSAGGDGVYQLAPRMADRFAATSMMAGHPNDASPLGLRNLPFSIHVGALDNGFNRNKVAMEWERKLAALRRDDLEGYIHWVRLYDGKGHWMDGQDAAAIPWMAQYTRNPFPTKVVWSQGHATHRRFYWLAIDPAQEKYGTLVTANYDRASRTINVETRDLQGLSVRVNDQMLDLDAPVTIAAGDKKLFAGIIPRTIATLGRTLAERGDPASIFSGAMTVQVDASSPR